MNFLGIPVQRLGVENWASEDFAEDARRSKLRSETHKARKQVLLDHGWELHFKHCSCHHGGEYAVDPLTGEHVSHKRAYELQEERVSGSIPKWPVFDNDWHPPASSEGLFNIEEVKVQPMTAPRCGIFYMDYIYGTQKLW